MGDLPDYGSCPAQAPRPVARVARGGGRDGPPLGCDLWRGHSGRHSATVEGATYLWGDDVVMGDAVAGWEAVESAAQEGGWDDE